MYIPSSYCGRRKDIEEGRLLRKEGRTDGRNDGRTEERKEGRKEGGENGWKERKG